MGLTFITSQQKAVFDPGYKILQNDRMDFSIGFWFKLNSNKPSSQIILMNENYANDKFLQV